jgi:hypothetical protein
MWGALFGGQVGSEKLSDTVNAQFEVNSLDDIIIRRTIVSFQVCFMQEEMTWDSVDDAACWEFLRCRPLSGCRDVL